VVEYSSRTLKVVEKGRVGRNAWGLLGREADACVKESVLRTLVDGRGSRGVKDLLCSRTRRENG